jgi:septal ring-binding cell division protein DamX
VPLYLGGGLAALAAIGVILAIVALASRKDEVAQNPSPSPGASTAPPGATPSPLPTFTPAPSASADPNPTPTPDAGDQNLTPTPTPSAEPTPDDGTGTDDGSTGTGTTVGSFPGWTSGAGYTIIIESASSQSGAEKVAQAAQDDGETVGILKSDEFSSLNGGFWVVFSGEYTSKSEAQDALDGVRDKHSDAYVRAITPKL